MLKNQFTAPILIDELGSGTTLERLPLTASGEPNYDENWLQKLLYNHPEALPISEIDQSYLNLVPICREMNTSVGPIDVLYSTPEGKLIILEAKLWRNPEARRKVIGQILDYAKELGSWSYEDLQREVSRALRTQEGKPGNLFNIIENMYPDLSEANFIDSVSRNLRRGEFLLLIVGDGIRDAIEIEEEASNEMSERQKFYYEFWGEFIAQLKLDDQSQPLPYVTKQGNIFLKGPAKSNAWITIYFWQKAKHIGVYLTFFKGSVGDMLYAGLVDDKESIEKELGIPVRWQSKDGKHSIEVYAGFPDLYASQYREPIKLWLADHANLFVNVFRPRIERIMEDTMGNLNNG